MKKVLLVALCGLLSLGALFTPVDSLAGKIVTPNGGRAILWKGAYSSGSEYVAYISSGNPANMKGGPENKRFDVSAYGYNSKNKKGWYRGWINQNYWRD